MDYSEQMKGVVADRVAGRKLSRRLAPTTVDSLLPGANSAILTGPERGGKPIAGVVTVLLGTVEDEMVQLEQVVLEMGVRLGPVLSPDYPRPEEGGGLAKVSEQRGPVAVAVGELRGRVAVAKQTLLGLLDRLEV